MNTQSVLAAGAVLTSCTTAEVQHDEQQPCNAGRRVTTERLRVVGALAEDRSRAGTEPRDRAGVPGNPGGAGAGEPRCECTPRSRPRLLNVKCRARLPSCFRERAIGRRGD